MEAWNSIPAEITVKSFGKCGISNALDGSENGSINVGIRVCNDIGGY